MQTLGVNTIWSQYIKHFNQNNLFAFAAEMKGCFATDHTATDQSNSVSQLIFFTIYINGSPNIFFVYTRNLWYIWLSANCNNDGI